jgi:hypothetical protein
MEPPSPSIRTPSLGLLLAESRVLQAVASDAVLQGTPAELIRHLDVGPEVFRAALHDLIAGGWIFATTTEDGQLIVGRERRRHDLGPPDRVERRSPSSRWEGTAHPAW